jgi:hypothetical protein
MIFEFIIVYHQSDGYDIKNLLCDNLKEVLEDNLNEFDQAQIEQFIDLKFKRLCGDSYIDNGIEYARTILGFQLNLPDETLNPDIVITDFCNTLADTPPIIHVVKYEDQLLLKKNIQYSKELYFLEMKLRRVLSVVYLNSYKDEYYSILRDESIQPMKKEQPTNEQMRNSAENQFFHLTFGQYIGLNNRKLPANVSEIIEHLRECNTFEDFKEELERAPIEDETDQQLLASLRDKLDPIEKLRNCVAHNRMVSERLAQDYMTAKPALEADLDSYLQKYAIEQVVNGLGE